MPPGDFKCKVNVLTLNKVSRINTLLFVYLFGLCLFARHGAQLEETGLDGPLGIGQLGMNFS